MTIKHIIAPHKKDLGGFSVRRLLPHKTQHMVGPWIFFDHMGPANFEAGQGINVRPHPHINLAAVTYLFEGEIFHRDSLGNAQSISPGDINLMIAGKGIVHSEREREQIRNSKHRQHGLQLWHALPETQEEIDPAFYHYEANSLPELIVNNTKIRLMIGEAYGISSPVKHFANTLYAEVKIKSKNSINIPNAEELAIYVVSGSIIIDSKEVPQYHMAILHNNSKNITAETDTRIAIIGGDKMSKRYIEWNFVSSKKERIKQAKQDWKQGKFPKVPGDDKEFIPLPE